MDVIVTSNAHVYSLFQADMSGVKRKLEGSDPDYEDISLVPNSKRNKADEHNGKLMLWTHMWQLTSKHTQVSSGVAI